MPTLAAMLLSDAVLKGSPDQPRDDHGRFGEGKSVSDMKASEINRELDRANKESSKLNQQMIDAGRGNERPSECTYSACACSCSEAKDTTGAQWREAGPNPPTYRTLGRMI
jgi:hypothetical protein